MEVNQSVSARTETSITMAWNCDETANYLWYFINNQWTGVAIANSKSGTYTISGLNPNAKYKIKTKVRATQEAETPLLEVETYSYPYCNSLPNFIIGDRVTLGFYNPLGRRITAILIAADGSTIASDVTTGETLQGFNGAVTVDSLLQSIPDSQSGVYSIKTIYGDKENTRSGGVYTVSRDTVPALNYAQYEDTNADTVAITQNDQLIIRNQSTVQFTAVGLAGGAAASVTGCSLTINGDSYIMTINDDIATVDDVVINSAASLDAFITVTDSRGMTYTQALGVTMLDWALPTALILCQRQNNFDTATNINVNALYSSINGHNTIDIKCRYKKTTDSTYGADVSLNDGITSVLSLDNLYVWNVQVVVTDLFGSTTYNTTVSKGTPILFIDKVKNSVGVNCFPQFEQSLEVNGINLDIKAIPSGADLNDLVYSRYYYGTGTYTNSPTITDTFLLSVYVMGNKIMQVIETCNKTSPVTYKRFYYDNAWGAWL